MFYSDKITKITDGDKVLEIGPGANPHPRSDVFLDKEFTDEESFKQNGLHKAKLTNRPTYYYSGKVFPFKDKEFDYVICSHVIEHVDKSELNSFMNEIQRVAKKGYIELPRFYYENLFNFYVHKWYANYVEGELLLLNKEKINFNIINDVYYLMLRDGFKKTNNTLIKEFSELFIFGFEWENEIKWREVDSIENLVSKNELLDWKEYFKNLNNLENNTNVKYNTIAKNKSIGYRIYYKLSTLYKIYKRIAHREYAELLNFYKKVTNYEKKIQVKEFYIEYKKLKQQENITTKRFVLDKKDLKPILNEKESITGFDKHYIYHPAWAANILKRIQPTKHVDISSTLHFSSLISAFIPVDFHDFHKVDLDLKNFSSKQANLTNLYFKNNSIESLSCMHVVEHIGLGRYGDEVDYDGDIKAMQELARVLALKGNLLFVVPVGNQAKILFNAHRIYEPSQIINIFKSLGLKLEEFTLIPDSNKEGLVINPTDELLEQQNYACGCFWFVK